MGEAVGLYFRGMSKDEVNALRARLNKLAGELGYTAKSGPTFGAGNMAALLIGIDKGHEAIVHLAGQETETVEATIAWLRERIVELNGQGYNEATVLTEVVNGLVDALKRYQERSET